TESSVLDKRRPAGGEVAHRAIAEPAAVCVDVDTLGNRELGRRRIVNVMPEHGREPGYRLRVRQFPAVCSKQLEVPGVVGMDVERKLEPSVWYALRQRDEL